MIELIQGYLARRKQIRNSLEFFRNLEKVIDAPHDYEAALAFVVSCRPIPVEIREGLSSLGARIYNFLHSEKTFRHEEDKISYQKKFPTIDSKVFDEF